MSESNGPPLGPKSPPDVGGFLRCPVHPFLPGSSSVLIVSRDTIGSPPRVQKDNDNNNNNNAASRPFVVVDMRTFLVFLSVMYF